MTTRRMSAYPGRCVLTVMSFVAALASIRVGAAEERVGTRPYEMEWAGRVEDTRPPTVDFESDAAWTVEVRDAIADFRRSREQQLFGKYVGKLTYRASGPQPQVTVRAPQPVTVPAKWDSLNVWVYGNNWAWAPDKNTPQVRMHALFRTAAGGLVRIDLGTVHWQEWWLMHRRLTAEQIKSLAGGEWIGFQIDGGRNRDDRLLYFDNLSFYEEPLPPLTFAPRPARGVDPFPGQTVGTNTGRGQRPGASSAAEAHAEAQGAQRVGRLPFPTRPETILPDNLAKQSGVAVTQDGEAWTFAYSGDDGRLTYRYAPQSGTWSDFAVDWAGKDAKISCQPMQNGGVALAGADGQAPTLPEKATLVECRRQEDTVVARWRCAWQGRTVEVTYTIRLWQKSLVIDVACPGGVVQEVRFGRAVGLAQPRLVTLPYLMGENQRPAVVVSGPPERPLFLMGLVDHTRSNASALWFVNAVDDNGVAYNGGARYQPKTDGRRNDCFERIFLTVSPRFEEVLPNVPNPPSPWMHVAGDRVWYAHGAHNREHDYALWKRVARHGITQVALTDHETGWRDGGESFTFRTRAAPGKGGDAGQAEYAKKIRALGFRYGIYNNYTDFAPVNEHWHEDMVSRLPDGQWRTAWARCYNPKPARAVEYEARLAPRIQQKFQLDTAYCDVHTAVTPWAYCDFDARVPGAGTFAATFYAYGEIMLHQKQTWNGPVYSEGNNHWYYCGLTDGNYGQDQAARLAENPWLVDFDLRKLHPLCCNFGMGNMEMFFGGGQGLGATPEQRERRLDQFLAATLAFGHTGFLVMEGGMGNTFRSYYGLQPIHARYAQAKVAEIRYADAAGKLLDTSAAVASGAFRRSQIATRYDNGLVVVVNGHATESWKISAPAFGARGPLPELPPFGWFATDGSPSGLMAFSALVDGHRVDYTDSARYLYADSRGRFARLPKVACDGPVAALREANGAMEVIPVAPCTRFGVSLDGRAATAVALDEAGKELGPAATRFSRGLVFIEPVKNAFSYRLQPGQPVEHALNCDRASVVPGERVTIVGRERHAWQVPADAAPGTQLWQQFEGQWIDFEVRPLVAAQLELRGEFRLQLLSHAAAPADAQVQFDGRSQILRLTPGHMATVAFPPPTASREIVRRLPLQVQIGPLSAHRQWWLKCEEAIRTVAELARPEATGQCLRGGTETPVDRASGAISHPEDLPCGDQTKPGLFMHPPYQHGVGYSFARFAPIDLPADGPSILRCLIGKRDGSDPGDGILFRVAVVEPEGNEIVVAEKQWIEHAWTPLTADLARWAGRRVAVKLIADVGPKDNSAGDWACWSEVRLVSATPVLTARLHDTEVRLTHEDGPSPPAAISVELLRQAKQAWLHYRGIGLQRDGQYVSYGKLNGVSLGQLPAAGGDEQAGRWADATLPLPAAATAALALDNVFVLDNPGRDFFKIGRLWLELERPDGRKVSSQINTTIFTQPPEWPHAEGTRVPFTESITVPLRFRPAARATER